MKAMSLDGSTPPQALVEREIPIPTASKTELLIRVHAVGVTPTELSWYPTTHTKDGATRLHAVPGHEFSGVVATVGEDVAGFRVGQEIYGMSDWFSDGATAEYCLTTSSSIAEKPDRLTHVEAASVPIGALTARQGLLERARLRDGERVLIHGGAGAVGVFAIQLAKLAGAQVFTTASSRHEEFLVQLGADHVIDYRAERFEDKVRDLDVIFDCVGGETLQRSWAVLKPGGRMVTIAAENEDSRDERTKAAFFIVEPNYAQLMEIRLLLDRGKLKTFVDGVWPLQDAAAAYFGTAKRPTGRGKQVIDVASRAP
jgi:NADPH:quinone reductase-like Zn-dependent oxidoreductase